MSDARNDALLDDALGRLPRGSGFIYRHYHLPDKERAIRFEQLASAARASGQLVILSGDENQARRWGAGGIYGAPDRIGKADRLNDPDGFLRLAAAHDECEIAAANQIAADAVLVSPVFPTASHPGAPALGPDRFRHLVKMAKMPVIALGGMNQKTAKRLGWQRWAAIDGLVLPTDS